MFRRTKTNIDWILIGALVPIIAASLVTLSSFTGDAGFVWRQIIWIGLGMVFLFVISQLDVRFLRDSRLLMGLYGIGVLLLIFVLILGVTANGATSWIAIGGFSLQPSDPMKVILILVLSKYLSRRHVQIRNIKHIFITGLYTLIPFALVLMQPDFGSAMVFLFIWLGMILVSGISKRHLLLLVTVGALAFGVLWGFVFAPYQKDRIRSFIQPLTDVQGAGYNAYQSTIAVGSGQALGKGLGYGTQSRLAFLPEYETDFIFAAFAEEWGFIGVLILLTLYGIVVWRLLQHAIHGRTNFEILFAVGVLVYFMGHVFVNIGMNVGLLPVTGIPLPFMSYGGSHFMTEMIAIGILFALSRNQRISHKDDTNEFIGIRKES
jgi:rod shape determining protein RodA